jgi:hypothetical protein
MGVHTDNQIDLPSEAHCSSFFDAMLEAAAPVWRETLVASLAGREFWSFRGPLVPGSAGQLALDPDRQMRKNVGMTPGRATGIR